MSDLFPETWVGGWATQKKAKEDPVAHYWQRWKLSGSEAFISYCGRVRSSEKALILTNDRRCRLCERDIQKNPSGS